MPSKDNNKNNSTTAGIESSWKIDKSSKLDVKDTEWDIAKQIAAVNQKKITAQSMFKIDRKKHHGLNHSFLSVDGKLIALARGKSFINEAGITSEGILGHGAYSVCKIGQNEKGERFAIKIEPAHSNRNNDEESIMAKLGVFKGAFTKKRPIETPWINSKTIKDKRIIVQKLQPGKELSFYISKKCFSLDYSEYTHLALKLASAIRSMHDANIVHGDIKPENFIVDKQGAFFNVAAVDFGFSVELLPETLYERSKGHTPKYSSPETLQSHVVSKASDVYALGKVFKIHFDFSHLQMQGFDERMNNDPVCCASELHATLTDMLNAGSEKRPTIHEVAEKFKNYYEKYFQVQLDEEFNPLEGTNSIPHPKSSSFSSEGITKTESSINQGQNNPAKSLTFSYDPEKESLSAAITRAETAKATAKANKTQQKNIPAETPNIISKDENIVNKPNL